MIDHEAYSRLSKEQKERLDGLLAQLDGRLTSNPLEAFRPHSAAQESFFSANTPIVAAFAGNRFGKTSSLVVRALIECLPTELIPEHLRRYRIKTRGVPAKGRIICPGKTTHIQGVLVPELRKWCPKHALKGGNFDKAYRTQEGILEFLNGSWIQLMTYEQDVDKFGGAALDFIGYDEPPPQDIREECVMRLPYLELFAMTPLQGAGYVYRSVYKKRDTDPDITVIRGSIHDNTTLSEKDKNRALASFDDPLRRQAREFGDFMIFAGLIYPNFSDALADAPTKAFVQSLDVVVGIDPGLRNAAFVWMGFDSDNVCYVFDDWLIQDGTPKDYVQLLHRVNKEWGITSPTYVIDPSARNRSMTNAMSVETNLQQLGIYPVPGYNPVEAGIQDVRKRMQDKSIWISKSCRGLIEEFEEYRAEDRPDGEFKPVKERDHRMDAMRYACMYRSWGGYVEKEKDTGGQVWTPGEPVDLDAMLDNYNPQPDLPLGSMM
jgi:phage terminase large subunit-like protein